MQGMSITHGEQCIHHSEGLPPFHTRQSEEDANSTPETFVGQQGACIYFNGHTQPVAESNHRQTTFSNHDILFLSLNKQHQPRRRAWHILHPGSTAWLYSLRYPPTCLPTMIINMWASSWSPSVAFLSWSTSLHYVSPPDKWAGRAAKQDPNYKMTPLSGWARAQLVYFRAATHKCMQHPYWPVKWDERLSVWCMPDLHLPRKLLISQQHYRQTRTTWLYHMFSDRDLSIASSKGARRLAKIS